MDHYFVALSLYNLGLLLRQAGRPAQAAPLLRQALAIWEAVFSFGYPTAQGCLRELLTLPHETASDALYRRVLQALEPARGPE